MIAVQSGMLHLRDFAIIAAGLSLGVLACCGDTADGGLCGDTRLAAEVYYGTDGPTFAPLTAGQIMAIGRIGPCSGVLIAPTWALSAYHCSLNPGATFCMGAEPNEFSVCVPVVEVLREPVADSDLVLLQLERDVRELEPAVEPIPIITESLDDGWLGEIAEAAGYGETENQVIGTRHFTAEPIVAMSPDHIDIDGQGVHGLCGGDSGGPLLVIASDNTTRVAGTLFRGDSSCVGIDQYSRVDRAVSWIESFTGTTEPGPAYCGAVDAVGMCSGARAIYCADGALTSRTCGADDPCGWDDGARGFRCLASADPCAGFDRRGACIGQVATWCDNGVLHERSCAACLERCYIAGSPTGAYCIPDPCGGLDLLGRCNGDVAEWCDNGQPLSRDCAALGQTCGYIDDNIGYYCM